MLIVSASADLTRWAVGRDKWKDERGRRAEKKEQSCEMLYLKKCYRLEHVVLPSPTSCLIEGWQDISVVLILMINYRTVSGMAGF